MATKRGGTVSLGLALFFLLLAAACLLAVDSALAVVLDLPAVGIVLGILSLLPIGIALRRRPAERSRRPLFAVLAAALVVTGLLAEVRFLRTRRAEVRFRSGAVELAGTLHLPRGEGPYPAVVLVHGSGPETRAELRFWADLFARHGIAGLAYDKRGAGESSGRLYESTYQDYAEDVAAAVRHLRGRTEIDAGRVGLVGFSEAEWVAPLAAASMEGGVAFLAVVGASGVSPAEQVSSEIALRLRARGTREEDVRRALELNEQALAYQRTGEGGERLEAALRTAKSEPWFRDAEDIPEEVYPPEDYRWWRSVMDFDPEPAWRRVRAPVLLLKGGRDPRSPAVVMAERIPAALARGGNRQVRVRVFPEADHALLEWPLGEGVPPPVFADGYPEALLRWVEGQAGS
jgi:uncharacterized protein